MSSPAPAPAKVLQSTSNVSSGSSAPNVPNAALLISVTLIAIGLAAVSLVAVLLFMWRRSRHEGQAHTAGTGVADGSPEKPSVIACRKPVVIINPSEESITYGRRDSSYFPSFFRLGRRSITADKDEPLPDACEGGYYVKGAPGFFAVDLEMGMSRIAEDVSKAGSSHQSSDNSLHSTMTASASNNNLHSSSPGTPKEPNPTTP